eukprot:SAG31_NODE_2693_length_5236_cov_23.769905_2_plen_57_part_00
MLIPGLRKEKLDLGDKVSSVELTFVDPPPLAFAMQAFETTGWSTVTAVPVQSSDKG